MSEEIKLSTTAARMVIGLKGKKHYMIPTQVTLAKMDDNFEVELVPGERMQGVAGDCIGLNSEGELFVVRKDIIPLVYRPARAPKTKKEVKKVPTV